MNGNELSRHDQVLLGLVYSFQVGAMQQLGKVQDPETGEIRRDLDGRDRVVMGEKLRIRGDSGL